MPWSRAWQHTPVFLPRESPCTEVPGKLQFMGLQRVTQLSNQAQLPSILVPSPVALSSSKFWWILTLWSRLDHIHRVAHMKSSHGYLREISSLIYPKLSSSFLYQKLLKPHSSILKNGNFNTSQFLRQNLFSCTEHPKYVYVTSKMESNPSEIPHDGAMDV